MSKIIIRKINDISDEIYLGIYNELDSKHKKRVGNYSDIRLKQHLASILMLKENKILINEIKYNENGKPYTDKINFSVSHCDEYVVVVISKRSVGVDIERIKDYNHLLLKYLNIGNSSISNESFFIEYTKKEALIKMLGLKLADINKVHNMCKYMSFSIDDYIISLCYGL